MSFPSIQNSKQCIGNMNGATNSAYVNQLNIMCGKGVKVNQRRPFSASDDAKLMQIINSMEFVNWDTVAIQMSDRTSRQCRERWVNYLNPTIRNDPWSDDEDRLLLEKVNDLGKCWTNICGRFFNGRSENDIKNRWYSHLRYRAAENDDGKYVFVTDPNKMPFPDRKKRNRRKACPIQNALKIIEQQKQQQNFNTNINDINSNIMSNINRINMPNMNSSNNNNNMDLITNININNIVRSNSYFCLHQQSQELMCQTPSMLYITPHPSMEFGPEKDTVDTSSEEKNVLQKNGTMVEVSSKDIALIDMPTFNDIGDIKLDQNENIGANNDELIPEFVDFWDRHLLDEAAEEFHFYNNVFNEFRFDSQ